MSHSFSEAPTVHFCMCVHSTWGFSVVKNPPANGGEARRGFRPWVRKILWRRKWHIAPVFLPGKLDGQRNLVGYILTQWNYVSCCIGPPKMNGSWWRVLTKRGPLEKGITNHFSILALKNPMNSMKRWKVWQWKMNSVAVQYATGESWEMAPEEIKRLSERGNNTQL